MKRCNFTRNKTRFFCLAIFLVLLFGLTSCGKKDKDSTSEENEEPISVSTESDELVDKTTYSKVESLSNATFFIRGVDTRDNVIFNPSILDENICPYYYWCGAYPNMETGEKMNYNTVPVDTANETVCFHTEEEYRYFSKDFDYYALSNVPLTKSLIYVNNSSGFMDAIKYVGLKEDYQIFENILCVDSSRFKKDTSIENVIKCSMPISYTNIYGSSCNGVIIIVETTKGQSMLICGGKDFTDVDIENMINGFSVNDNISNILDNYTISELSIDLGGKYITGNFNDIFAINPANPNNYTSNRYGFSELFSANTYAEVASLIGVYYAPKETNSLEFMSYFTSVFYTDQSMLNSSQITDSEGRVWDKYNYCLSEIPHTDFATMYVYCEGNYVYLIGVYYQKDTRINYEGLMDETIKSIKITNGQSIPYVDSTDYMYACYGMERPAPEPEPVISTPTDATPTDAVVPNETTEATSDSGSASKPPAEESTEQPQ